MEASIDISKKRTVLYSLGAPEKMAIRKSGNKEKQPYRSKFMRDRDRVLYSKAFRRLAGKTQVYLSGVDDHKRTRLTHTLEVSQIAKTIASNLLLNVDLTEAIALGHDIGHTPYGHSGERTLHEIMVPHLKNEIIDCPLKCDSEETKFDSLLGFKHNLQSVQTAIVSERYYQNYGLDLTNFTLFGLIFHSSEKYDDGKTINPKKLGCYDKYKEYYYIGDNANNPAWSFEAFVVREADEIAQRHHDLEDAIRGSLITKTEACNILMEYFKHYLKPKDRQTIRQLASNNDEYFISNISRIIVNLLVNKLTESSIFNMNQLIEQEKLNVNKFPLFLMIHSPEDDIIRNIINYEKNGIEDGFLNKLDGFKKRISEIVLASYEIQTADAKGRYIITKLFQAYYKNPQQLPNHCIEEYLIETYEYKSQSDLQEDINKFGMGHIRKNFIKIINNEKYGDKEKVILMRVICNYIAGMTDNYALKMYQELYI